MIDNKILDLPEPTLRMGGTDFYDAEAVGKIQEKLIKEIAHYVGTKYFNPYNGSGENAADDAVENAQQILMENIMGLL